MKGIKSKGFWLLYALELLPNGSKVKDIDIVPKTTLEMRWVTPDSDGLHWLVINYYNEEEELCYTKFTIP